MPAVNFSGIQETQTPGTEGKPFGRFIQNINHYYQRAIKKMIRISSGTGKNKRKISCFLCNTLVLLTFLILQVSSVTANPVSPGEVTQVTALGIVQPAPSTVPAADPSSAMEWTPATEHAQFSDRQGHSTVVFDDSLWVIGGMRAKTPSTYFSEVWRSDDGITWTLVTPDAAFGGRAGHRSVVFDNRIWVIGGRDGKTLDPLNDVWYSADGITWTQATASAPFAPRWDFGLTVFDGRMWVLGGSEDGPTHNDVWYSSDGVTWTEATPHAGFSSRMEPSAVTYNGKIWVTGGFDWAGVYNDIWTSEDGVKWTLVSPHAPFIPRRYQNMESAGGKLWVIGGSDGKNTINDVWYTTDGITWTQVTGQSRFPPRYAFTTASFRNQLWVIAGTTGNDVWYSGDLFTTGPVSSPGMQTNPPAKIIVTKTVSPSSIKVGTDTMITITVLNKGPFAVHDIEILDTTHQEFPVIGGITRYSAQIIEPDDRRIFTYTVHAIKAGSFQLNRTTVMYADQDGNYRLVYSNYGNIRVLPSLLAPASEEPSDNFIRDLTAWINGFDPFA
jgi:hypothetical protein